MKVKVYSKSGKIDTMEFPSGVFESTGDPQLLSQARLRLLANRRGPIASTKTRGEVRGGGRKPFRQKGTGRARAGSNRSPLWIGGGITFGPRKDRNFSQRINRKMVKKALRMAFSGKIKNNKLIVVSDFNFPKIATSQIQDFLEKLPLEEGKILIILSQTNVNLELSVANLAYIKVRQINNLNVLDLLNCDYVLTDKEGIKSIEKSLTVTSAVVKGKK